MKLTILIPYYYNHPECEVRFKRLIKTIIPQITNDTPVIIYEDGQVSEWLKGYATGVITLISNPINKGVAYARNILLDYSKNSDYILFLDSDDMIDCDFIRKMYEICTTNNYEMIISNFMHYGVIMDFPRRCNVAGISLRNSFIKGMRFKEDYNISEDTLFINEVYDKKPNIFKIDSVYYYNYGANPNSLMMRFERSELKLMKGEKE